MNGGSTSHGTILGETGRQRVRDFYYHGGNYVGSCAGHFIVHLGYTSYFKILPGYAIGSGSLIDRHPYQLEQSTNFFNNYASRYTGLQDGWVDEVRHYLGGATNRNIAGVEYLGRHRNISGEKLDDTYGLVSYKDNAQSGRQVVIGSHPEYENDGERMHLMAAMLEYALAGQGEIDVKASLQNGLPRQMNNNNSPGYERIGDKQYHHFIVDIPSGVGSLTINLDGNNNYDLDLFVRKGGLAIKGESDVIKAESSNADETIVITNPEAGRWYMGVKLYTEVATTSHGSKGSTGVWQDKFGLYWKEYTGNLGVLNGVEYTILADWELDGSITPTPTPTPIGDEVIVDDQDADFSTSYTQDAWQEYYDVDGQHYGNTHHFNRQINGEDTATWVFSVPNPGSYEVYAWWVGNPTGQDYRSPDVPYTINHTGGGSTVEVNQKVNGGQWNLLGEYNFQDTGSVIVSDNVSSGRDIVADAIRLLYQGPVVEIPGDVDGDGDVDISDLVIVGSSFGKSPGDAGYDPRADANDNGGAIDIADLVLVGSNFGS